MLSSSILSTLHLLALALGLPGVFLRGRALRRLKLDEAALPRVLAADNAWGAAALLWLATGLLRAFWRFEKGPEFYLASPLFWVKMGLFIVVALLEVWPMVTFLGWRRARARGLVIDRRVVPALIRVNDLETVLTLLLPFVASAMARGLAQG